MKIVSLSAAVKLLDFWKLTSVVEAGLVGFEAGAGSWYNKYGDGFYVNLGLGLVRIEITVAADKDK